MTYGTIDPKTGLLDISEGGKSDLSKPGGLELVQKCFGRDVDAITSHSLEAAPVGYVYRKLSRFAFDQPAVPIAVHALRIFGIGDKADIALSIAGEANVFWIMGRISGKASTGQEMGAARGEVLRGQLSRDWIERTSRLSTSGFRRATRPRRGRDPFLEEQFFPPTRAAAGPPRRTSATPSSPP